MKKALYLRVSLASGHPDGEALFGTVLFSFAFLNIVFCRARPARVACLLLARNTVSLCFIFNLYGFFAREIIKNIKTAFTKRKIGGIIAL